MLVLEVFQMSRGSFVSVKCKTVPSTFSRSPLQSWTQLSQNSVLLSERCIQRVCFLDAEQGNFQFWLEDGRLVMSTKLTAGMQRYYAKGRLMLWSAAGLELPILLAAIVNIIWVIVVETSSAGDAWWIAVLIFLPVLAVLLAAATSLQLALSVAYFSQAQAMQMHADSLRHRLNKKKQGTG